jgi:pimeloyl-ACP methyl ester carboxylesterase
MTIDAMVNDIQAYMDHYGLEKVYLLGHSLVEKVLMQYAITYPEKVEKLIVADMAPKAYPPHHQGIFKALNTVDLNQVTSRQEVEEELKKYIRKSALYSSF